MPYIVLDSSSCAGAPPAVGASTVFWAELFDGSRAGLRRSKVSAPTVSSRGALLSRQKNLRVRRAVSALPAPAVYRQERQIGP
jgi:hypothetical protein